MSKVELLQPGKISGLIELVQTTGQKYQEVLHTCAVQCLAHAAEHGDKSLLARLIGGKIKSKQGEIMETHPGVIFVPCPNDGCMDCHQPYSGLHRVVCPDCKGRGWVPAED